MHRTRSTLTKSILAVGVLMLVAGAAFPLAYNPWGPATGAKVFGVTPFVKYDDVNGAWGMNLFLNYGFTDDLDLFVDVAPLTLSPDLAYGNITAFARYQLFKDFLVGFFAYLPTAEGATDPSFDIAVHYTYKPSDSIALQANVFFNTAGDGALGAYLAANYYFSKQFGLYVEVNPYLSFTSGSELSLGLNPGVFIALDKDQKYTISAAILTTMYSGELTFNGLGLWFYTFF